MGLYLWLTCSWPLFRREGRLVPGLFLFVALALLWYLMMLNLHGQRYTTSAQGDTIGPFLWHHGRTRWHLVFPSAGVPPGLFPLERPPALCLVSGLSKLAEAKQAGDIHIGDRYGIPFPHRPSSGLPPPGCWAGSCFSACLRPVSPLHRPLVSRSGDLDGVLLESLRDRPCGSAPACCDPHDDRRGLHPGAGVCVPPASVCQICRETRG